MFFTVLSNISVLVICMAIGFVCQKKGIITDKGSPVLSGLLVKATLPCLMIVSMQRQFDMQLLKNSMVVIGLTIFMQCVGFLLGLLLCKLMKTTEGERNIWAFSLCFGNITYMGIPIIESIYGDVALFYVYMANIVFNVSVFTVGTMIINWGGENTEKFTIKSILLNVPVMATILGFLFFLFSITIPFEINKAFALVGNMTVPLSMIVIGSILAKNDLKTVFLGWKVYVIVFAKLIILPIFMLLVLKLFIKDELIKGVMVSLSGMPVATITAILATQYNRNGVIASKIVFISTLLSIVSIPLITLLF